MPVFNSVVDEISVAANLMPMSLTSLCEFSRSLWTWVHRHELVDLSSSMWVRRCEFAAVSSPPWVRRCEIAIVAVSLSPWVSRRDYVAVSCLVQRYGEGGGWLKGNLKSYDGLRGLPAQDLIQSIRDSNISWHAMYVCYVCLLLQEKGMMSINAIYILSQIIHNGVRLQCCL